MGKYSAKKNVKPVLILLCLILLNVVGIYLTRYILSYTILTLIEIMLVFFDLYELYYIISTFTISYEITNKSILIKSFLQLRDVEINLKDIKGYKVSSGHESGVKLSGFAFLDIMVGRAFVKDLGLSRMYATSNNDIIYIITDDINYAITPIEVDKFIATLQGMNLEYTNQKELKESHNSLHRDKAFMIPFCIITLISFLMFMIPFIIYLKGKLPYTMPLSFDMNFNPMKIGTGKQFAFQQMIYGGLNLSLLLCMYFAGHFTYKYDKKSSYKYIYISLIVALTFFVVQIRILNVYL